MGFFADIIADSRYRIRRPGTPFSVDGADFPEPIAPEQPPHSNQPQRVNQSQSGSRVDVTIGSDIGLETPSAGGAEGNGSPSPQMAGNSQSPGAQSVVSQAVQAPLSPIPKVANRTGGAPLVQCKPAAAAPTAAGTVQPTVAKWAAERRSVPTVSAGAPQGAVAAKSPAGAGPVHRVNSSTLMTNGRAAVSASSPSVTTAAPSSETAGSQAVQEKGGAVTAGAVTPDSSRLLSQPRSSAEVLSSGAVMAGAVEQHSTPTRQIVPMTAEPTPSGMASKRAPPQVRIGQVNVIVEGAAKPERAPPPSSTGDDFASRNFLRSL